MDGKLRTKRLPAQVPPLHMRSHLSVRQFVKYYLLPLDEFDLVAFGRVNEGNSTAVRRMWSVGQWITFCRGVFSEFVQIVDFKCEMREIGAHDNRAALVEFAYLNFPLAAWCFQEDKL
jgi:hypothetical protein